MSNLGEQIKMYREKRKPKMLAKDLAKQVGVTPTYIAQIEKHSKSPSPDVLLRIILALELDFKRAMALRSYYIREKYPELATLTAKIIQAVIRKKQSSK